MAIDKVGERGGQVDKRVDGIELAGLDERGDARPVLCRGVMTSEKSVLAIERYWSDGSLGGDLPATRTR